MSNHIYLMRKVNGLFLFLLSVFRLCFWAYKGRKSRAYFVASVPWHRRKRTAAGYAQWWNARRSEVLRHCQPPPRPFSKTAFLWIAKIFYCSVFVGIRKWTHREEPLYLNRIRWVPLLVWQTNPQRLQRRTISGPRLCRLRCVYRAVAAGGRSRRESAIGTTRKILQS